MTYANYVETRKKISPLAVELRMAVMRTSRRLRVEATSESVTAGKFTVLALLGKGPLTLRELANAEHVQAPSMTRTVNGLEEAGLVRRTPHPTDGRQILADLTEQGREILTDTRQCRTEWLEKRLAKLSNEERRTLREAAEILQRVAAK
ncbi:transcriptional regulator, MarR family [Renibacterium salmoninarum ATCC 33209]|uniref:Transcriptional regulator, MarR family n=1 Tax=Renibacterium salmoninarum (strain ATCC 33209 / DSM 20767 / JCM 11484 / NBRC 15589 / NCIMB 2235) TaxID=288705 RepID=A9WLN2_RENSM|nr:MarR family transcriptional regulator [Renibacterium salmoninarum]ABY21812.1 transcriptional regulator, MarR family [Renibacterium salmoninarum ATCC 33209]